MSTRYSNSTSRLKMKTMSFYSNSNSNSNPQRKSSHHLTLALLVVMAAFLTSFVLVPVPVHAHAHAHESQSCPSQSTSTSTSESASKAIKTMKLYSNIERIDRQLAHMGYSPDQELSQEILSPIDSMHYLGDAAIEAAIGLLRVQLQKIPNTASTDSTASTASTVTDSIDIDMDMDMDIDIDAKVLDVGSGFGGPARYMASRGSNISVVALELQPDVSAKGKELTQRCNFSDQVTHINGDILKDVDVNVNVNVNMNVPNSGSDDSASASTSASAPSWTERDQYDMVTSWLVFLHITEKNKLYQTSHDLIRSGGHIYIEDFYRRSRAVPEGENASESTSESTSASASASACGFTEEESIILSRDIYCEGNTLHTKEEYIQALEEVGFVNVTFVDMTDAWRSFVQTRYEAFLENQDSFVEIHGIDAFESLSHFFNAMNILFQGDNLGGVRIHGTKK